MIRTKTFHTIIALIVITNVALGLANWVVAPESSGRWIAGIMTMPLIWAYVLWSTKRRPLSQYARAERRFFILSVPTAGIIITLAFGLRLMENFAAFSFAGLDRAWGIGIGLLLIAMGNIIPKILPPLSEKQCSGVESQSVQRFAGWAFVLAGLIHTLLWIFATTDHANTWSMFVVMTAVVLVVIRYFWAMRPRTI